MQPIQLHTNRFYHIYNRGINGENLFIEPTNYDYFLTIYEKNINCIADTYSYCLMKNHFHFLIKIKTEEDLKDYSKRHYSQAFSNLFNTYTKAFNKRYNRSGTLFERPFKRKQVDNPKYLKNLIRYIHNNPVHHGYCDNPIDYPWSSYLECIKVSSKKIEHNQVISLFENVENFKKEHQNKNYDFDLEF